MSLKRRLTLSLGTTVLALLLLLGLLGYLGARSLTLEKLKQEGELLARYQAQRVRATLDDANATSEFLANSLRLYDENDDHPHLLHLLKEVLNHRQGLQSIEISGLPEGALAVSRDASGQVVMAKPVLQKLLTASHPLVQGQGTWLPASTDPTGHSLYRIETLEGLTIILEVPVRTLADPLNQNPHSVAYGFLATKNAILFTTPTSSSSERGDRDTFLSQVLAQHDSTGDFFRITDPIFGKAAWMGTAPVGELELTVGVVYLEGLHFRPLFGLAWGAALVSLLGILGLFLAIIFTSRSVSAPLVQLANTVGHAVNEKFTQRVPVPHGATSEVEHLTHSFNRMLDDLHHFLGQLEKATKERQAIESELAIAASIQGSMLPKFPFQNSTCEAVGLSLAAHKVGGDFVNIFPISSDRIGFFIGDVSGKGIPGAITMAFTASLLEHLGKVGLPPKDCLKVVNRALCARDEISSFVTVFFGILHLDGTIVYANAGHHPPMIFAHPDKLYSPSIESGLALGIFPETEFASGFFKLSTEERLMLYTDGLTEAMNQEREEYGDARLQELLRAFGPEQALNDLLDHLCGHVQEFRSGATPNDDLTILLLRRHPSNS